MGKTFEMKEVVFESKRVKYPVSIPSEKTFFKAQLKGEVTDNDTPFGYTKSQVQLTIPSNIERKLEKIWEELEEHFIEEARKHHYHLKNGDIYLYNPFEEK